MQLFECQLLQQVFLLNLNHHLMSSLIHHTLLCLLNLLYYYNHQKLYLPFEFLHLLHHIYLKVYLHLLTKKFHYILRYQLLNLFLENFLQLQKLQFEFRLQLIYFLPLLNYFVLTNCFRYILQCYL